jgi:uncharacterized protein
MNIREELEHLRRTVARIDRKYAQPSPAPAPPPAPTFNAYEFVEDLISGEVLETPLGKHFETERLFPRGKRHGSYDIADLADLPPDLLAPLSDNAIAHVPPSRWAFLDTETTGLAGGSGTCAFLVGIGSIAADGFRVRQFFMRDFAEERSMLHALSAHLKNFDVLITYNGKAFDQPLLETRYRMCRAGHPFNRLEHLDLLFGARRLFKLRLENCRLVNLEQRILGLERQGDLPGEMIPYVYFEYLRTQRAWRLAPLFHHNVMDIVTLACLTGLIPAAFRDPASIPLRHGLDLLGIARWTQMSGRLEEAYALMRRAVDLGLPDRHLFRTLFDCAALEKKLGREHAVVATLTDLTLSPNPYRARAWEELGKHYERRERNFAMAIECVREARGLEDSETLRSRHQRLEARLAKTVRKPRLKPKSRRAPRTASARPQVKD